MIDLEDVIKCVSLDLTETKKETIQFDTRFRDISEWSSLYAVNLMSIISQELKVNIDFYDFIDCETVGDLYRRILQKKTSLKTIEKGYKFDWND